MKKQKLISLLLGFLLTNTCFASSSTDFRLDYDSLDTSFSALYSDDFYIDGGFLSIERIGSSADFKIEPVLNSDVSAISAVCGNGLIESGEVCDSGNFNGLTCIDYGFSSGSLTCVSCVSISTETCTSSGGASNPAGNSNWIWGRDEDQQEEEAEEEEESEAEEPEEGPVDTNETKQEETEEQETQQTEDETENKEEQEKEAPYILEPDETTKDQTGGKQEQNIQKDTGEPDEIFTEPAIKPTIENKEEAPIKTENEDKEEGGLYPAAEPKEELDINELSVNVPWLFSFEYHLKVYHTWQEIEAIDQTPLLAGNLEKNRTYSLNIYNKNSELIENNTIKTNKDGDFSYETEKHLEPGKYKVVLTEETKNKTTLIRTYKLDVKEEAEEDKIIDLGAISPNQNWPTITTEAAPLNTVFVYIENQEGLVELFQEQASNFGLMSFVIPTDLPAGSYKMHIIELTEAGKENYKITKDITYLFEINNSLHAAAKEINKDYFIVYFVSFWLLLLFFAYRLIVKDKK